VSMAQTGADQVPSTSKRLVHDFWERAPCGEAYAQGEELRERLEAQARERYKLEPYIREFARFWEGAGREVLEIGVGLGADHLEWARAHPRRLAGVDLTERAARMTRDRIELHGFRPMLQVGDAENLPFADESFDIVYAWGVLHHSPDTQRAIDEVRRVLRPGGRACVMIYHRHAIVGYMLWLRYALLRGRPWWSLRRVYAEHLESPGTKAYTVREAKRLFRRFGQVDLVVRLSCGDLLEGVAGQRHAGRLLMLARRLWPRRLIRAVVPGLGLFLVVEAVR
jgi:ubiquinone/menaquinone biosynthesis C-methylase UbiE